MVFYEKYNNTENELQCKVCKLFKKAKSSFLVIPLQERIRAWFHSRTFCELMENPRSGRSLPLLGEPEQVYETQ
eukprot:Nk52_evm4s1485 gene=Nk52_evmTU4s1485